MGPWTFHQIIREAPQAERIFLFFSQSHRACQYHRRYTYTPPIIMHSLTWITTYWTIHPRRGGVWEPWAYLRTQKKKRFRTGGFIEYGVPKFYMAVVDNHSLTDLFKGMQISTLELPAAFEQNAWAAHCCFLLGPALLPPSQQRSPDLFPHFLKGARGEQLLSIRAIFNYQYSGW